MAFKSVLKFLGLRQNSRAEDISLFIDESATNSVTAATDGILEGTRQALVKKNGTGDYTITLNRTARRDIVVVGVAPVTVDLTYAITSISTSQVRIVFANLSGTDTNTDFWINLRAFYSSVQR